MDFPELLAMVMERDSIATLDALAKRVDYTQGGVSKWMQRVSTPRRKAQRGLAEKLDVPLSDLAAAVANTVTITKPSVSAQLRECQQRVAELERENGNLKARLAGD